MSAILAKVYWLLLGELLTTFGNQENTLEAVLFVTDLPSKAKIGFVAWISSALAEIRVMSLFLKSIHVTCSSWGKIELTSSSAENFFGIGGRGFRMDGDESFFCSKGGRLGAGTSAERDIPGEAEARDTTGELLAEVDPCGIPGDVGGETTGAGGEGRERQGELCVKAELRERPGEFCIIFFLIGT
jgi:hypothetical protein